MITDTPSVSEVSRVVARYPLGVHASQNLLHDTPWVCTSTGIHDTLRVCINHKLRGLAVKCTCHTPHSAHTHTVYTCSRVQAELYDRNPCVESSHYIKPFSTLREPDTARFHAPNFTQATNARLFLRQTQWTASLER